MLLYAIDSSIWSETLLWSVDSYMVHRFVAWSTDFSSFLVHRLFYSCRSIHSLDSPSSTLSSTTPASADYMVRRLFYMVRRLFYMVHGPFSWSTDSHGCYRLSSWSIDSFCSPQRLFIVRRDSFYASTCWTLLWGC